MKAAIGYYMGGDHDDLKEAITKLLAPRPIEMGEVSVPGLAGPNSLVHFLLDLDAWQQMGLLILGLVGRGYLSEGGKELWHRQKPILQAAASSTKTSLLNLVSVLQNKQDSGLATAFGFTEPTFDHRLREERVYLEDADVDEVARELLIFAQCAPAVHQWLMEQKAAGQKHPLSLTITSDGTLIAWQAHVRRVYSTDGRLLFEERTKDMAPLSKKTTGQ